MMSEERGALRRVTTVTSIRSCSSGKLVNSGTASSAASAGAETIFGYRRDAAIGKPLSMLIVPPHLRGRLEEGLRRMVSWYHREGGGQVATARRPPAAARL